MALTLHIKNMVCNRCVMVVREAFVQQGLHPTNVVLGEVTLEESVLTTDQQLKLDERLYSLGFERIDDRRARLVEAIKSKIIQVVHHSREITLKVNWSTLLSEEMHYDYNYLSNLFSGIEGITLEQYIIRQKIEKAKELLIYNELTLSEIAHKLDYSSVAHLSAQFKKITGFTPSQMRNARMKENLRKPLDSVS